MICIDVSGEHIEIVSVKGSKQNIAVESSVTLNAPPDLFSTAGDVNFPVLENCLRGPLVKISEKKVVMSFSFLPTIYSVLQLHKERNRQQQRMAVESQVYANISPDDYYVDYFATGQQLEGNKQTYVSYAMPKKLVDNSFEMLRQLGKVPTALVPSQHAAESFIDSYFPDKTVALAKLSQKSITLHLLNPPDNMITRNAAIDTGASSSLNVLDNIGGSSSPETVFVQNIEKLNSYQSIKFPGKAISQVLLYGRSARDELVKLVSDTVGVPCAMLSGRNKNFANCAPVYTIGAFLSIGKKDINFYSIDRTKKDASTPTRRLNVPLLVALLLILINIGVVFGIMSFDMQMQNMISQKEDELSSPETLMLLEEFGTLREEFVGKLKSESALTSLAAEIEKTGEFNRELLNRSVAAAPEGVTITSVAYSGTVYNFACTGQTEQQAADYVESLTSLGIFGYVGYFGFSDSGEEVTFTVTGDVLAQ